jgi:HlyD family secretion protein
MSGLRALLVAVVVLLGLSPVGYGAWRLRGKKTERPPTAGTMPTKAPRVVRADGRVVTAEGGRVTVGAEATGTVDRVLVREGALVRAGDPLVVFRGGEQAALIEEAHAQAREAHVSARYLEDEVTRTKALVASGALPKQALDKAVQDRDTARARRAAAGASAKRFTSAALRNRIVAPISGTIITRTIEPGETVPIGTPLFVIADLSRLRVDAEVDELDALRVVPGMTAKVTVDGADLAPLAGKVEDIGLAVGARALRPQDPARPTDAQILHVMVGLEEAPRLKLGQRVTVSLEGAPPGS